MTTSSTVDELYDLLEGITETIDTKEVSVIGAVDYGEYDRPSPENVVAMFQSESDEKDLDLVGDPVGPYWTTWYITIFVKGTRAVAAPRLHDVKDMVLAEWAEDITIGSSCVDSRLAQPKHVLYSTQYDSKTGKRLTMAATIIIEAFYTD